MNSRPPQPKDDLLTVSAISVLGAIIASILHEGLGHAATALLTGVQSGLLTTVSWSSAQESRLVAAAGTLANLAAALVFYLALRSAIRFSVRWRLLLVLCLAFNLFDGTGYFFFSGVTNFGDWSAVISGLPWHWLWRLLLILSGMGCYFVAVFIVASALLRFVSVPRNDTWRLRALTYVPYFSAVIVSCAGALLNPIGIQLLWQSALPATAGANSGLLWLRYYLPLSAAAERPSDPVERSYAWIAAASALSLVFIFFLGRGVTLHR